ncbi:MAG: tetratricopeptide repeat protein [Myxococcota bacterium]
MLIIMTLACVLNRTHQSVYSAMQQDVQNLVTDIDQIERELDSMASRLQNLEELTQSKGQSEILSMDSTEQLRMEMANLRNDLDILSHDFRKTASLVEGTATDSTYRLTWLESRAQQLENELGLQPPTPPTSEQASSTEQNVTDGSPEQTVSEETTNESQKPAKNDGPDKEKMSPDELMTKAEALLKAGKSRAAEVFLQHFIDNHKDHKRYAEALYRYAEAAFHSGDYKKAARRFQTVIEYNKKGPWASWAMLFQGDCFKESGSARHAKVFYESVIKDYPNSKAAKEAKVRLKE